MLIDKLKPNPKNPRRIGKKEFAGLKKKIRNFPEMLEKRPIIYDKDLIVLGGNQRLRVLKELVKDGFEIKDSYFMSAKDWTKKQKRDFVILDNIADGEWDYDLLANEWDDLPLEEWGVPMGWKGIDEDEPPLVAEKAISKAGELYQLGEHRLFCGDSTKVETFNKLFGDKKADLLFTDPPYNVDYDYSKYRDGRKMKWKKIFNDNKSDEDFLNFLRIAFQNAYDFTIDGASYYVWHADKTARIFLQALEDTGWRFSQRITWVKDRFVLSMGQHFHRMFEPCMHGWKKGEKSYFAKKITNWSDVWNLEEEDILAELDLWKVDRDLQEEYEHPTQKPVRLAERALIKSTKPGDIVLDMFGGSGSTMIACEQLQRKCFLIELDPLYCDVIRRRYARFIGKEDEWQKITPKI